MKGLARAAAMAALAATFALAVPAVAAAAAPPQSPPTIPPIIPIEVLLPILGELQPVLEVISPIAYPPCANALLVSVLPGALGVALPPELSLVTGPLLVLCGSVPEPLTNRRICALDVAGQDLLAQLTIPLLGTALPVEVAPTKWVTGLLDSIVDQVPDPAVPIGSTIAAELQCIDPPLDATTTTTAPAAAPAAEVPTTAPPVAAPPLSFSNPPSFAALQTLPARPPVAAPAAVTPAVPIAAPEVVFFDEPRFRYPIVMGLPLAFVGLFAFFGRVLNRPLDGVTA